MTSIKRELWELSFRDGFAKNLSREALIALRDGLKRDDPRLIQGRTMTPDSRYHGENEGLTGADPICYALWQSGKIATIGEAFDQFEGLCYEVDAALTGRIRYASRAFVKFWDSSDRKEVREKLLAVVTSILATDLETVA